jgi:hypothetical protein
VVTGVRGSGKTTMLRQRIWQLIESGVHRENILYLDLSDDRLYWLRSENPDLINQPDPRSAYPNTVLTR